MCGTDDLVRLNVKGYTMAKSTLRSTWRVCYDLTEDACHAALRCKFSTV